MKVHIATSRPIGKTCISWAGKHLPKGCSLASIDDCHIFISVLYEHIIPATFIKSKVRCYNFHPGILPQYRGTGTHSWPILIGDHSFGVTLHEIDDAIDHGPIVAISNALITQSDTAQSLYKQTDKMILKLFKKYFKKLVSRQPPPSYKQDESIARLYLRRELQAQKDITRIVRAFHFPGRDQAFYFDSKGTKHFLTW